MRPAGKSDVTTKTFEVFVEKLLPIQFSSYSFSWLHQFMLRPFIYIIISFLPVEKVVNLVYMLRNRFYILFANSLYSELKGK